MMKPVKAFVLILLLTYTNIYSQVGIGTTTPDDGSMLQIDSKTKAFVPPRMTDAEMKAISTPLPGAVVYNTTDDALFVNTNTGWNDMSISPNAAVVLNKAYSPGNNNNVIQAKNNNSYTDFPIGHSNVLINKNSYFEVVGNGKIKVKKSGVFLLTVALSVQDMPAGSTKFVIGVELNGTLIGYPTRGVSEIPPGPDGDFDFWGTSGTLVYPANMGDTFSFQYVLNNGTNSSLDARFLNLGIMKL